MFTRSLYCIISWERWGWHW